MIIEKVLLRRRVVLIINSIFVQAGGINIIWF